ncbi:MAG: glycerophosphodiester phosphodiesterase [Bryobacteraceae bacterium]|nr:glycerophosphodiester phosphodiesterase [Bryobacteraceae bacterium]
MRFVRWGLWTFAVLVAAYVYFAALHPHQEVPAHPFFDRPGPWAIAHRGGRGLWPENTLYAFEKADGLGVDVVEMDLRATSDGVIVAMHDATVDRTTDGSGRVDGFTFAEIRRLDAGYRFADSSGQFPFRGRGVVVPAFEEVLSRFQRTRLNVEMKAFSPALAVTLCRLIEKAGAADRVLVASFDQGPMSAFRRACPAAATSATAREALMLHQFYRLRIASLYRSPAAALQVPARLGGRVVVEPGFVELARRMNLPVQVWTVNEEAEMKRLLAMGAQGILTDYPDRLLRALGRLIGPER